LEKMAPPLDNHALRINMMGIPEVWREGVLISFHRRKTTALIMYLAGTGQRWPRRELAELFWPDSDPEHGLAALRTVLAELNRSLPPGILVTDPAVYIPEEGYSRDYDDFRRLGGSDRNTDDLAAAADLCRGPFLQGLRLKDCSRFEDWRFFREQALLREQRDLLCRAARSLGSSGRPEEALPLIRRALDFDPFDERIHRLIMTLHAAAGDRTAALRYFGYFRSRLSRELGFSPEVETRRLADRIREGNGGEGDSSLASGNRSGPFRRRIAVLPFVQIGRGVFTRSCLEIAGLALSRALASEDVFDVVSHTSMTLYRGSGKSPLRIAQEVGVDFLVEGFIEITGEKGFLAARMLDAACDKVISEIREDIGSDVEKIPPAAGQAACHFSGQFHAVKGGGRKNRTVSGDPGAAWRLQAEYLMRGYAPDSLRRAEDALLRALEYNRDDAAAWAGLARLHLCEVGAGMFSQDLEGLYGKAEEAADKALDIDPRDANAWMAKAEIIYERDWAHDQAETLYRRSLDLEPATPWALASYAGFLADHSRYEEALEHSRRACELDPHNGWVLGPRFYVLRAAGLYRQADQVLVIRSRVFHHMAFDTFARGVLRLFMKEYSQAVAFMEPVADDIREENLIQLLGWLAHGYGCLGRYAETEALIEEIMLTYPEPKRGCCVPLAAAYLSLGQAETALDWLERAEQRRYPLILGLRQNTLFEPLYSEPRFIYLIQRLGLPSLP
jgi:DNA-binding SARP family transcriptional activator/Flp pilus assembly protein TadD